MPYFSINPDNQKLQLTEIDQGNKEIDNFVPAIYQGSLDVVAAVNQLNEKDIEALYDFVLKKNKNHQDLK